ncbi:MAG: sulfurtransferase complex subunit TusD [Acidiferrobacterales bacterium]|nr:sulfurtransferase complex subunit TusD [Gammaproteobacteria bacterium]
MKFDIVVNEGPYTHEASDTAYQFSKAALEKGHEVLRVFFYHDGVNNGTRLTTPPQDDRHITNRWSELAEQHGLDLVVCIAAAQRRGIVDPDEAKCQGDDGRRREQRWRHQEVHVHQPARTLRHDLRTGGSRGGAHRRCI